MTDKFEKKLFKMAEGEKMIVPEELENKLDAVLLELPVSRKMVQRNNLFILNMFRMNIKKALALSAVFIMLLSITAAAAVNCLRQRMETMNREKMEEYFAQIYTSKVGFDNYNRPYTQGERERMDALFTAYSEQGVFPEGELTMIDEAGDYKGKGVAFLKGTSTFFFPDGEMSDEQLLQILDFHCKRDYSLTKMNDLLKSGEAEFPMAAESSGEPVRATDSLVLQSNAVLNPGQELTIPYEGSLSVLYMAAGKDCIFLTGWNEIHKMEIGSGNSQLFFSDFDMRTRVSALYQSESGEIYLGIYQENQTGDWIPAIWVLNEEGVLLRKIALSEYVEDPGLWVSGHIGFIRSMAVDKEGYIYLRGLRIKGAETMLILDKEGKTASQVPRGEYSPQVYHGLGIGKDGKAYTILLDKDGNLGVSSVNPVTGQLENIHMGILPKDTIGPDIISPAYDADFVIWSYSGIFSYNLGEAKAEVVMPAYETPCEVEGSLRCALPDGRIVLADCSEYRHYQDEEGVDRYERIPEKTCFYYKSGLRK